MHSLGDGLAEHAVQQRMTQGEEDFGLCDIRFAPSSGFDTAARTCSAGRSRVAPARPSRASKVTMPTGPVLVRPRTAHLPGRASLRAAVSDMEEHLLGRAKRYRRSALESSV